MGEVWGRGDATVRQVLEALNRGPKRRAYTTVMTTMRRLHHKGFLVRERHGKVDVYAPSISRDDYRDARARAEVDALVDEFGDAALVHFSSHVARLDPERVRRLRELAGE
jgi:predicted transcriptional regulator